MMFSMKLSEQDRAELLAVLKSDVYDGSVSSRAQIVLWYGEGRRKSEIAAALVTSRPTVDKWIKRYEKHGMEGLMNRTSPGGPRQPDRIRGRVLALSRVTPPSALGISAGDSNTVQPAAPIAAKIEALRSLPPVEVSVTSLALVELRREGRGYRWDELERWDWRVENG